MSTLSLQGGWSGTSGGSGYTTQNNGHRGWRADRRRSPRSIVSGRVTALASQDSPEGPSRRICSLQLQDLSETGVGAFGQTPLPVGSRIALFFAPHGAAPGRDCYGTVVRCEPRAWGHDLGIRLDAPDRSAAA